MVTSRVSVAAVTLGLALGPGASHAQLRKGARFQKGSSCVGCHEEFGKGRPVTQEFPRIAYRDSMLWYGCDKPDLRNPIKMQIVSEHFAGSGFKIFAQILEKEGNQVRAIPASGR